MNSSKDFVDRLPGQHGVAHEENAWHALAGRDPGVDEGKNCSPIVGQQDSLLRRRPVENDRVGCCCQSHVSNVDQVQARIDLDHAGHDATVEVFVNQKSDHPMRPVVLARASSSSLLGPGGWADSS